jgi:hypothetical protein
VLRRLARHAERPVSPARRSTVDHRTDGQGGDKAQQSGPSRDQSRERRRPLREGKYDETGSNDMCDSQVYDESEAVSSLFR